MRMAWKNRSPTTSAQRREIDRSESKQGEITCRALRASDWPNIERLFGSNGACGGCWCMWWRVPRGGKLWAEAKGSKNRAAFRKLVETGSVRGVLAFSEDQPVGWCSLGPRSTFPRLERVKALRRDWSEQTWSINCFYIPRAWRGRGIAKRLVEEATQQAFRAGAGEVEGYPVMPAKSGTGLPGVFAWTGVPAIFESSGYRELPRQEGHRRVFLAQPTSAVGTTGRGTKKSRKARTKRIVK
jgi:predicted GNAT family acetyltransferase